MSVGESGAAEFAAQLRDVAQRLRDGLDVAPAQRFRLEGLAQAALAAGAAPAQLEDVSNEVRDCIDIEVDADGVRIECRQVRAPVFPSTGS